jgi:hypothetical protein
MRKLTIALCLVLVGLACGVSRGDLIILDDPPNINNRFFVGANKAFLGGSLDFSGVGNTTGVAGTGEWGTMVSPSFFLTAVHHPVPLGTAITFINGNDPNGTTYTDVVSSGTQIGTSDLSLDRLANPIPAGFHIAFYSVVADNEAALTHAPILVYGVPHRLGTNNIDTFVTTSVPGAGGPGRAFTFDFDRTGASGPNEAALNAGDSGGPSFLNISGQLALVGIHWFQETDSTGAVVGSGDTYVSHYINDINAAMAATGSPERLTIIGVPEPASMTLLGIGGIGLVAGFRRRRAAA